MTCSAMTRMPKATGLKLHARTGLTGVTGFTGMTGYTGVGFILVAAG